jgi:hypothetical protein
MGIQQLPAEFGTEEDGKRLSTEIRMKRPAFFGNAQFVNYRDRAPLSGLPMTKRYVVEYRDNSWKVKPAAASH